MKLSPKLVGAALLCSAVMLTHLAGAAEKIQKIKIMTAGDHDADPTVSLFSTSENLSELAEGESRVIVSHDGGSATVTRSGDQMRVTTSAGQEIEVPIISAHGVHVSVGDDEHMEKSIHVIRKHRGEPSNAVMVMTPGGLSDYEKQALRDAMAAAGIDKELHFVGDGIDGEINIEIETD